MFTLFRRKATAEKKIVNVPEVDLPIVPLTAEQIDEDEERSLALMHKELKAGFDFIKNYPKSVSFFGSARLSQDDEHCVDARALAKLIVEELGYAVITGGGPGIMEAANHGAHEAGGDSLGLTIKLPHEQGTNPYVKNDVGFYYFFTRKTILTFAAEAYIFFPGGFGTLDEFFDILTLVQTNKIPKVPLILVGEDFWKPLDGYIRKCLLKDHATVNEQEMALYTITDDHEKVIEIIKKTPVQNWWKGYEVQ